MVNAYMPFINYYPNELFFTMNNCKQLQSFDVALICIFIAHDMPIVGYMFPSVLYAVLVLMVFFMLLSKIGLGGMKKIIPIFFISLLYCIVQILTTLDLVSMLQGISGFFQLSTYTMVGYVVYQTSDLKNAKRLLFFYVLLNTITCLTTGYGCSIYPGAARHLAVGDEAVVTDYGLYKMANIDGFAFVYTMVLTLPIIIYWYRNVPFTRFVYKVIPIAIVLLLGYLVVQTEYTTALLLFLALCLLFVLRQKNVSLKNCILVAILCFCTFEVFAPLLSDGLQYMAQKTESRDMSDRLNDLSLKIIGKETESNAADLDDRGEKYMKSLDTFLSHPFGVWLASGKTGGHSYMLDNLARFGLIGLYFIWIMIKTLYVNYVAIYKRRNVYNYALFMLLGFVMLIVVNSGAFYTSLTFTLPLFLLITENKNTSWN